MKQLDLCIYEDERAINFSPLSLTRPVFDLRCGLFTLGQKIIQRFPGYRVSYFLRDELLGVVKLERPQTQLNSAPREGGYFINSRFMPSKPLPGKLETSTTFICHDEIAGAFLAPKDVRKIERNQDGTIKNICFQSLPQQEVDGTMNAFCWDLVHHNAREIERDFNFAQRGGQILAKIYPNVTLLEQENIHLGLGAKIYPGAVIDGESGPVYIADGAKVMSNAVIEGPAYIGKDSVVKIGAKIYGGATIGDVCKVGGEIEGSIIHGHSNKQHEGFLGHAYLGEWVNLGADTNNSDLKNNYTPVSVYINGKMHNTGQKFVGLFMGDHAKSGINTMFNTGTVVGVMANVFGAGYSPKYIPSFSWGGIERTVLYTFNKARATAQRVMERRGAMMVPAQEALFKKIYENAKLEVEKLKKRE